MLLEKIRAQLPMAPAQWHHPAAIITHHSLHFQRFQKIKQESDDNNDNQNNNNDEMLLLQMLGHLNAVMIVSIKLHSNAVLRQLALLQLRNSYTLLGCAAYIWRWLSSWWTRPELKLLASRFLGRSASRCTGITT